MNHVWDFATGQQYVQIHAVSDDDDVLCLIAEIPLSTPDAECIAERIVTAHNQTLQAKSMFELSIQTDTGPFEDDWTYEVTRLLRVTADGLEEEREYNTLSKGALTDSDGNLVGVWSKK